MTGREGRSPGPRWVAARVYVGSAYHSENCVALKTFIFVLIRGENRVSLDFPRRGYCHCTPVPVVAAGLGGGRRGNTFTFAANGRGLARLRASPYATEEHLTKRSGVSESDIRARQDACRDVSRDSFLLISSELPLKTSVGVWSKLRIHVKL